LLLPAGLLAFGIGLLAGCIYIPTFSRPDDPAKDASLFVGEATSRKPLRVGTATRLDIEKVLGAPLYAREDGRRVAYVWRVTEGVWIMPFCFTIEPQGGTRMIVLEFDRNEVLNRFRMVKSSDSLFSRSYIEPPEGMRRTLHRLAQTRPSK